MPITNQELWNEWIEKNQDAYGKACVTVAGRVMELLDSDPNDFDCHGIISRADDDTKTGGITGFMAGCVAQMVSRCHGRGEEFRRKWNTQYQIHDEGDRANESGGIINPALVSVEVDK